MLRRQKPYGIRRATLYKTGNDLKRAITSTIDILTGKVPEVQADEHGYYQIDDICTYLRGAHPELDYINHNHIVELYFKDTNRKILINGFNRMKYKEIRYVKPPDTLYFGTVENLVPRMLHNGIHSSTKKYVKLHGSFEAATNFGQKFLQRENDEVAVLEIDAGAAFTDGMRFSVFEDDEYIIVRVDRKYIRGRYYPENGSPESQESTDELRYDQSDTWPSPGPSEAL